MRVAYNGQTSVTPAFLNVSRDDAADYLAAARAPKRCAGISGATILHCRAFTNITFFVRRCPKPIAVYAHCRALALPRIAASKDRARRLRMMQAPAVSRISTRGRPLARFLLRCHDRAPSAASEHTDTVAAIITSADAGTIISASAQRRNARRHA